MTTDVDMSLDEKTLENLYAAHHVNGIPPEQRLLPFRNIRHVLSLHAKTAGQRTFLISYDAEGRRAELTYGEFNVRVHQTANFMHDDLGVQRGDRVAVIVHTHGDMLLVMCACWVIGASVVPLNVDAGDDQITFALRDSEAGICFVPNAYLDHMQRIITSAPNIQQMVTMGGEAVDQYLHLNDMVKNLPMTYLGDGAPVKSNDDTLKDPSEATALLDDEALLIYSTGADGRAQGVVLTQYNLLVSAWGLSQAQAITGGQRLMTALPLDTANAVVTTLILPLLVGASVVLNETFVIERFWRQVVEDRVSIVSVDPPLLEALLKQGRQQESAGQGLFGANINRRGLTRFRHFVCSGGALSVDLAREFEGIFGFTVLNAYGLNESAGDCCCLPIDLTWEEHQHWLQDHEYASVGIPMVSAEMAIFAADGRTLDEGERGEICIRGHNIMKYYLKQPDANHAAFKFGWLHSGEEGFYKLDERGRKFFFVTGRTVEH